MPSVYRDFQTKNSLYYIRGLPHMQTPGPPPFASSAPPPSNIHYSFVCALLQRGGRNQNVSEHHHLGELWFFPEFSVQNICYITSTSGITSPGTVKTFQSCTIPPGPADPDAGIRANTYHHPQLIP